MDSGEECFTINDMVIGHRNTEKEFFRAQVHSAINISQELCPHVLVG